MFRKCVSLILILSSYCIPQSISGTVTSSITQTGIQGAKILLINNDALSIDSTFSNSSGNWNFDFSTSGIEDDELQPSSFIVAQNYPNPFNPSTTIEFSISIPGNIQILVHNILGELIDFKEQYLAEGNYSVEWNSKGSAGIYFYTSRFNNTSVTKKMIQLDGGNGRGFGEIRQGEKLFKKVINKNNSINATIFVSKSGFITDTINAELNGGEHFNSSLVSVHSKAVVIDLHNDILEKMVFDTSYHLRDLHNYNHTDIPRLKEGGVDIQFFAVWVDPSEFPDSLYFNQSQVMLNIFNNEMEMNPDEIVQANNLSEALNIIDEGNIAAVIGVEGGHTIENDLENLRTLYDEGMRYMTITWNNSTDWAISAQDPLTTTVGLSDFGKEVIRTMDSLGVIIDVSHTGIKTIEDILQVTTNPIIATHSNARALRNHYRNLSDEQIIAIANTGGVIGVCFYPPFLGTGSVSINTVIQHINYIVNLVGIDHVAIGSDFDGIGTVPSGLEDVSKFPDLTLKLIEQGYSNSDVEKILGGNFMRVFQQVCGNTISKYLTRTR